MEKETYKIMEYDRIREMLADRASSRIGKEQAKTLEPSSDFDEVAEWLAETTEAVTVLETAMPPFGGIFDIRPLLKKAKMGVVLDLDEITDRGLAATDLIALAFCNAEPTVAPFGGATRRLVPVAMASQRIIALNCASVMENQLPDALTDWQDDTFVTIEIVDFERNAIDVARIDPPSVKAHRHPVTPPARSTLDVSCATPGANANKLMRMCQDALARF